MKNEMLRLFTESSRTVIDFFNKEQANLVEVVGVLATALRRGHKLILFGNGGSAADAQHVAAEFVNRMCADRNPLPALALTVDSSVLTSIGNDCGFDKVFSRQVEALGKLDDVAFAFSTSGNSPNVLAGVAAARRLGIVTVGFTGGNGGRLAKECDYRLVVPSTSTPRIQEAHILAAHVITEMVEREIIRRPAEHD